MSKNAGTTIPDSHEAVNRRYLVGVQGLRSIAALLVAVYHIWFNRVSGGVDVFFMVAGFFATISLAKIVRLDSGKNRARAIVSYYSRTARRVIPSAALVVIATSVAAILWMPRALWDENLKHAISSMFFMENWWLIRIGSDYLQQGLSVSPFQQYWALAIQVQMYAALPILVLFATATRRVIRCSTRRALLFILSLACLASFAYALRAVSIDQSAAYFDSFARAWQFLAGGVLSLLLTAEAHARPIWRWLGWSGLVALVSTGVVLDLSSGAPGVMALVLVAAAGAIISSAWNSSDPRIIHASPLVRFADSSFAFYLWHWPLLVFYRYHYGDAVSVPAGILIICLSAFLAVITTKFVERPVRSSMPLNRSSMLAFTVCILLVLPVGIVLGSWGYVLEKSRREAEVALQTYFDTGVAVDSPVPTPLLARDDVVAAYERGCHQTTGSPEVISCEWGASDGSVTIALVGGSHSLQWLPAVERVAEDLGARVISMTKSACVFGDITEFDGGFDSSCRAWADAVMDELLEMSPDVVVTIATRRESGVEVVPDGYRTYFAELSTAEIPVVALRDNPWFSFDVPVCVELRGAEDCSISRSSFFVLLDELDVPNLEGFTFVDLIDDYCDAQHCGVIDGELLMYRDRHHLTTTWVQIRGDRVIEAIRSTVETTWEQMADATG